VPPPTYEESLLDLPPDYTCTDALATVDCSAKTVDVFSLHVWREEKSKAGSDSTYYDIDFSHNGAIQHAGKKAKQAAKKAQQAKWLDSDNEENKDGGADDGDGGDGGGGDGDGGAGAGGDGGDPPGGGNDDDEWGNTGGKKKKDKKKKKNAW
jgi:hypothetical protein